MAYTPPTTRSDGYVVTASVYNADLINNIIALRTGGAGAVEQSTSSTGAQANFDLTGRWTYLRCTGAAPVFSGFTVAGAAPTAGDMFLLECLGTTAQVTTQGGGSTAENRAICPSTQGQIVGVNGLMIGEYDGTTDRWRVKCIDPGAWIDVAHAGGNFTGNNSMTWTVASGDQVAFQYQQRGNRLDVHIHLETTTIGGTPSTILQITMPFTLANATTVRIGRAAIARNNGGNIELVQLFTTASSATLGIVRAAAAAWDASADNADVFIDSTFEIG